MKKRISRHMSQQGCRGTREYLELLKADAGFRKECEALMGVSISRFFRDRELWETLEGKIPPEPAASSGSEIKAWSAGCARGEEAYSLKILWDRIRRSGVGLPALRITATDINPDYLQAAQLARYTWSALRELPPDSAQRCFEQEPGGRWFRLVQDLRGEIEWLCRDFFATPPGSGFHLIFLRNNLLTYYSRDRVGPAFNTILNALAVGGFLVLGSREHPPFHHPALRPSAGLPYLFERLP